MSSIAKESKLLARHSMIYGLGTVINSIVSILLLPLYTRYLTPADYGITELLGVTVDIIGMLLATAISSGLFRFYFEYDDKKSRNEIISTIIIALSAVCFTVVLLLSLFTKPIAHYIIESTQLYYYFNISLISMLFQSINGVGFNYLRAVQKSFIFIVLSVTRLLILVSLNIYFIVFLKLGVLGVLLSNMIVAFITTCVLIVPILFSVGLNFSKTKLKQMLLFGFPLVPGVFVQFIAMASNRFFLKGYCSISDVGLYSLGSKFGTIPSTFVSMPFNQIWQPRRFELYKQPDSEVLFGRIFTYYLVLISFIGLGIAVLTREVLVIMSDQKFWSAYSVVPMIVLGNIILTMTYHFDMGLLIQKKTKYLAYISISNGIFILLLNFLLIPRYGIWGAAFATFIAFSYRTTLTYYLSSRIFKIHFEFLRIVKIAGSVAVLFIICTLLDISNVYASFAVKTFIILFFPVVLWSMGFYSKEEKVRISTIVHQVVLREKLKIENQQWK